MTMTFYAIVGLVVFSASVTVSADDPSSASNCVDTFVADIYYLVDSSNSINSVGWGRELAFVANVSRSFPFGPKGVHAAFGQFSTDFLHLTNLNALATQEEFSQLVLGTKQLKELTYTFKALEAIKTQGYLTSELLGARRGVPKFLFIVTDGQSQDTPRTVAAADELRKDGITIFCIGVGMTNSVELLGIAGNEKNYFSVKNFAALDAIRPEITKRVCEAPNDPSTEKPCPVTSINDVIFVIDSSGSVGLDNYVQNFNFFAASIPRYNLREDGTKLGFLIYGTYPVPIANLTSSKAELFKALENVPYKGSTTRTDLALLSALDMLSAAKGGRKGASKTVILVSDGKSTQPSKTLEAADELKSQNVNIITLGIKPDADPEELKALASRIDFYYPVANYSALISYANPVSSLACNAPPPPPPVKLCPTATKVDIDFLVDSSGSIGSANYDYNFAFIRKIVAAYYIGEDGAKVALQTFGTSVKPKFNFSSDRKYIESQLENVSYQKGITNTDNGLLYVLDLVLSPTSGVRSGVPKVCIVVTDGKSTEPKKTQEAAKKLKEHGITVISVGVGKKVDRDELVAIASKPEYVTTVGDYSILENFASSVSDIICDNASRK